MLSVHANSWLPKPSLPPATFFPLTPISQVPLFSLTTAQDRPGHQRTKHISQVSPWIPIRSYLGLAQELILAGGSYSHQTLKAVTAGPQDVVS